MGQFPSYFIGATIAGLVVLGLYLAINFSSPAAAFQIGERQANELSVEELSEVMSDAFSTASAPDKLAAVVTLAEGTDQLDARIKALCKVVSGNNLTNKSIATLAIRQHIDAAKPIIAELLKSEDAQQIRIALGGIHALGTEGDMFFKQVVSLLKTENPQQQFNALYALQNMSPELTGEAVDQIKPFLKHSDFNVQCNACRVLRNMGRGALPALDDLIVLFNEGNPSSRSRAAYAIAAIGPVDGYDIPGLLAERLNAQSQIERARLLGAIGMLGPAALEHAEAIEALMNNANKRTMPEAALAYYKVSGNEAASIKILRNLLNDMTYLRTAVECIGAMGQAGADAVPDLIPLLSHAEDDIVETTVLALGSIGPAASNALPKLNTLLKSSDYLIARAAEESIEAITNPQQQ